MVGKSELILVWRKEPTAPLQESTWDETEVLDATLDDDTEAEAEVVADTAETEADLETDTTPDETVDDPEVLFTDHLEIPEDQWVHTEGTTDTDKKTIKTICKNIKWAELDTMFLNLIKNNTSLQKTRHRQNFYAWVVLFFHNLCYFFLHYRTTHLVLKNLFKMK